MCCFVLLSLTVPKSVHPHHNNIQSPKDMLFFSTTRTTIHVSLLLTHLTLSSMLLAHAFVPHLSTSHKDRATTPLHSTSSEETTSSQVSINPLVSSVKISVTVQIFSRVKQMQAEGIDVTSLCVGEPDFPPRKQRQQQRMRWMMLMLLGIHWDHPKTNWIKVSIMRERTIQPMPNPNSRYSILAERSHDVSSFTRGTVLKTWATLIESQSLPVKRLIPERKGERDEGIYFRKQVRWIEGIYLRKQVR